MRYLNRKNNPVACEVANQLTALGLPASYMRDRECVPLAKYQIVNMCAAIRRIDWDGGRWNVSAEIDVYQAESINAFKNGTFIMNGDQTKDTVTFTIRLKEAKNPDKVAAAIVSEFLRRKPELLMKGM